MDMVLYFASLWAFAHKAFSEASLTCSLPSTCFSQEYNIFFRFLSKKKYREIGYK